MSAKRLFFLCFAILCCIVAAVAKPAKPGWYKIKQSDGTTLKIQAVGNAFNHAILTTDGLTVACGADGDFYYNSSLTGLTAVRAHNEGQRTPSETAFVNAQRANLTMTHKSFNTPSRNGMLGASGSNAGANVPANGSRKIPIILVEFKDKKFSNTREDIINAMLTGDESVGQYFRDQSNGLYQPEFDVYGIYTLSQNREYYGGNVNGNDKGLGYCVTEAVQLAAADGVSFAPYDTNSDNYCDVVIIIYAGVGEADASTTHPESIWPCNWYLSAANYYGMGGNGAFSPNPGDPFVDMFAVFNELHGGNDEGTTIDGIGTFTHEFGHCLGLPDLYDTSTNGGHYGLGHWDIMCMGCYNNDGFTPPGYSAYEKVFMGWMEYVTPQPGTYYTLPVFNQKNAVTDKAVCITSDLNANEYFILENRRKQGWDTYLPDEGIMITHVTYKANRWSDNTLNNQDIQLMTLMNVDNSWSYSNEYSDLWPKNGKTEFTDSSTPAAKLNMRSNGTITGNAGYLGKPVTDMVINQDGTASFWFMKDAAVNPVIITVTDFNMGGVMLNNSETQALKVSGGALTDDVTLTLDDPNGVFSIEPTVISASDAANGVMVNVTFAPLDITDYHATITMKSNGAEDVTVNLTGQGLIEGYTPVMLPANSADINLTQFRADWTDQTPAENLASYTLEVSTKPVAEFLNALEGTNYTGNYMGITLSAPWGGFYVYGGNNAVYIASGGYITYTIPEGYSDGTFTLKLTTVGYDYGIGNFAVSTPQTAAVEHSFTVGETYSWLVTASSGELITITSSDPSYSPDIAKIEVYSGDATEMRATETGDEFYRLITDITDKFYTVCDLQAGGTYLYRVKALFADGSESPWSNKEEVTLFENEHTFDLGDVNHDGKVNISDVTELINRLLSGDGGCPICADVDKDGRISISDVTELINILLSHH